MARTPPIDRRLDGVVAVVTGANGGVGREITRNLARAGATVVMVCRDPQRADAAAKDIRETVSSPSLEIECADLSRLDDVRRAAERILARHSKVGLLVSNAAIWTAVRMTNDEGLELTFATNVLSHHLLTNLLLPRLIASAPARIVNVASRLAYGLDLGDPMIERSRFDGRGAYARTKQANRMLTWALADALVGRRVTANAVHPGTVSTELFADHPGIIGRLGRMYFKHLGVSAAEGADTPSWLAGSAEIEGASGLFFAKRSARPCAFTDRERVRALVAICDRLTNSSLEEAAK
ncbi:MAG: SDR family NAD(P)-dependent oxidoreductase [Deltaproteobacteria bacterium]|nr:SDR family NAD(P)-dependent oxidoreductase [Deltaproteobacteria bacterium]